MKKLILIASLLMAGGSLWAEQLICDYPENKKKKSWYSFTISNKDAEEGLGIMNNNFRFYFTRSELGKEEDGTPFLYVYDIVLENGDTKRIVFNPFRMWSEYKERGYDRLKCRYSK